jgi:hypothetical protein
MISEEIKARVCDKARNFDKYLKEWQTRKREEHFEEEVIRQVELAERISEYKKRALETKAEAETKRRKGDEEELMQEEQILGAELENGEPVPADLERLCPEERAFVHAIRTRSRRGRSSELASSEDGSF